MCMEKKTITLSETQLVNLINKVVKKNSGISEQIRLTPLDDITKTIRKGMETFDDAIGYKQSKPTLKNGTYNNVKVMNTNNGVVLNINGVNYKVCS